LARYRDHSYGWNDLQLAAAVSRSSTRLGYSLGMFDRMAHWDRLHEQQRFRPVYPSEHVVRFLMASRSVFDEQRPKRFLDIGAGAGRHTMLAAELGFEAFGTDISFTGLDHARKRLRQSGFPARLMQASTLALPFRDHSFALALSYGVFYYGTANEMKGAIAEMRRVLVPGGRALVILRTTDDYRFGKGKQLEHNTFQLEITETNECGSIQHFLTANDVPAYFVGFSGLTFERTDSTFASRTAVNSDWLITGEA
jgi:ubiquinone/menaquinone biosynthesis C-methylase UbiE